MQAAIRIILYTSDLLVPFLIFYVVAYGILMKELEEGFQASKRIETPQEDQQSQLTWTLGAIRF